jgi:hypothetical protein
LETWSSGCSSAFSGWEEGVEEEEEEEEGRVSMAASLKSETLSSRIEVVGERVEARSEGERAAEKTLDIKSETVKVAILARSEGEAAAIESRKARSEAVSEAVEAREVAEEVLRILVSERFSYQEAEACHSAGRFPVERAVDREHREQTFLLVVPAHESLGSSREGPLDPTRCEKLRKHKLEMTTSSFVTDSFGWKVRGETHQCQSVRLFLLLAW